MELVFFYVVKSESGFIENTGFNFSPNYKFSVDYNNEDDVYILKQEECITKLPRDFFDEDGCITNVTAIVGENGSGKTTLLNMLLNHSLDKENEADNDKFIVVYLDSNGFICYYNVSKLELHMNEKKQNIVIGELDTSQTDLSEIIPRMFATNNMFTSSNILFNMRKQNKILNDNPVSLLKKLFYGFNLNSQYMSIGLSDFNSYVQIVSEEFFRETNYQSILDFVYMRNLDANNIDSIFRDKFKKILKFRINTFCSFISDSFNFPLDTHSFLTKSFCKTVFEFMTEELIEYNIFYNLCHDNASKLYLNLLFELLVFLNKGESFKVGVEYKKYSIVNKKTLKNFIKCILKGLDDKVKKTFYNCFEEITMYDDFFAKLSSSCIDVDEYVLLEYGSDMYIGFMELIKKSLQNGFESNVLKYISVIPINLASGERALLNLFSWFYLTTILLPSYNDFFAPFNQINKDIKIDSILILIDEVDLYCHPAWQQKLLKSLIEEVKSLFKEKKVQIIFSTHSPIVLSDLPRNNIIFLKRENDKCSIYEDNLSKETFGTNIYKLFKDAFFLDKGQIGEFAKDKIEDIIRKIKPKICDGKAIYSKLSDGDDELAVLEQQISLIGEPIIRYKLYDMLYKNFPKKAIDNQIRELRKKIEELESKKNKENSYDSN